jgi:hypothetical protein
MSRMLRFRCFSGDTCEQPGDGPVLEIVFARRRSVGMLFGDQFINNTDYDLCVEDREGVAIGMIAPGEVFVATQDVVIFFDANVQYAFRSYLNQGYRGN